MTSPSDSPRESGKIIVADNPWHIAAAAKERGVPVSCIELDGLPADKVYVIDADAIRRGIDALAPPHTKPSEEERD